MTHLTDYLAPKAEFFEIEATVNLLSKSNGGECNRLITNKKQNI